jgi:hypothetical protein
MHPGPETAVGKAIMCFGAVEILSELTLGDVGNEADMGSSGLQGLVHIQTGNKGREMATIPGAAKQGG